MQPKITDPNEVLGQCHVCQKPVTANAGYKHDFIQRGPYLIHVECDEQRSKWQ